MKPQKHPFHHAVVTVPVASLLAAPDDHSPVVTQVILGEAVRVAELGPGTAPEFVEIETSEGYRGWARVAALRSTTAADALYARNGVVAEVTSLHANVYREPSFTSAAPIFTIPLGTRLEPAPRERREGRFLQIRLPSGAAGFICEDDITILDLQQKRAPRGPQAQVELGRRLLGAPYTWGGRTPAGFDCSGLVQFLYERDGTLLPRDAWQQCFLEPRLHPVEPANALAGDLLFFGNTDRIDHVAMRLDANGELLESTRHGRPGVKITNLAATPHLQQTLRYARRLVPDGMAPPAAAPALPLLQKIDALRDRAQTQNARLAFYYYDLTRGQAIERAADEKYYPASTFKTAVYLELLRRADAGQLRLDDTILFVNDFRSALDGSRFSIEISEDQDLFILPYLNKNVSLGELGRQMMVRSSNLATNALLGYLGAESIQQLCQQIHAEDTRVVRGIEDARARESGIENQTTARSLGRILEACVQDVPGLRLSAPTRAILLKTLLDQFYHDGIPDGIPAQAGARVGHKSGLTSTTKHDSAFVILPNGITYILVVLVQSNSGMLREEFARELISEASRACWEHAIAPPQTR